jgi:hypothetical protein
MVSASRSTDMMFSQPRRRLPSILDSRNSKRSRQDRTGTWRDAEGQVAGGLNEFHFVPFTSHEERGIRHYHSFAKWQGMYREFVSLLSSTCGAPCNVRELSNYICIAHPCPCHSLTLFFSPSGSIPLLAVWTAASEFCKMPTTIATCHM